MNYLVLIIVHDIISIIENNTSGLNELNIFCSGGELMYRSFSIKSM